MAITEEAINKMKQLIVSGTLRPGTKLPDETDLAADLQVSQISLRETLDTLVCIHILEEKKPGDIFVSGLDSDLIVDAIDFLLEFHLDSSVLDAFGVRKILEPPASGLAARHMSSESIADLRLFADLANDSMTIKEMVDHDLALHHKIAIGAGNPLLASTLLSLGPPTRRARIWRGLTQENASQNTRREHSDIVEAIERRDPELAYATTFAHIAQVEEWLRVTYDPTREVIEQLPDWNLQGSD